MWCGPVESGTDCGNGETGKGMNGVVGWRDDVMEVCLALFLDFCFFLLLLLFRFFCARSNEDRDIGY